VRIDLDHNATTRLDPRVAAAMREALDGLAGNPSSIHEEGRRAREAVERARAQVAALLEVPTNEVFFTSGGTEADTLALLGLGRAARAAGRPARALTTPVEHSAVSAALAALEAEGWEVLRLPIDGHGRVAPDDIGAVAAGGLALASFIYAQNELGNLYPIERLAAAARALGAVVHSDAVQALGKVPVAPRALGLDAASVSAHKIHGPKGVGALWLRGGVPFAPPVHGHHERGMRPGTENVLGIVGFGVAASLARAEGVASAARQAALRDRLEAAVASVPGARRHGDPGADRLPNTLNLGFVGVPGDVLVAALDLEGVMASTGSACTSGTVEPSKTLSALGLPRERATEGVRLSLGRDTTEAEVERVAAILPALVDRIRRSL
jgi:cysteine desulfurase